MALFLLPFLALLSPLSAADLPHSALLHLHPSLSSLNGLLTRANLTPELDRHPQLTILAPHIASLHQLLDSNLPPQTLAEFLRHQILPEYRSFNDLVALARNSTPFLTHPQTGSLRFRLEESGNRSVLHVELPDKSSRLIRKKLLDVPARISVLETRDVTVSRATAPAPAPATSPTPSPAPAPAPTPANITQLMVSAGMYNTFISLLQSNKVDITLQSLANQTQGVSIFCPTDKAFSSLRSGLLSNLSSQQTVSLLEYHAMPAFHPLSTFQQTSNSVFNTLATQGPSYTLNVSNVNGVVVFATGYDTATLVSTLYNTNPAALYAIDHVLLPVQIVGVAAPTPAPSPSTLAPSPSSSASGSSITSSAGAPAPEASAAPPPPSMRAALLAVLLICGCKLLQL